MSLEITNSTESLHDAFSNCEERAPTVGEAPSAPVENSLSSEDLQKILSAWQDATSRLEQTHSALRAEVRRLTDELEIKNRELARKNRLADLGQMAAHIAHEVRNTLVPVSLYMSMLRRNTADDAKNKNLVEKVGVGLTALEVTVNDLLHFTADREAKVESIVPAALIRTTMQSLEHQLAAQNVTLNLELDETESVELDRELLRRAILNIALNGLDVLPNGGQLSVTARACDESWQLEIADNGPGWSEDALMRGTEPFFTTKHHGTGLGLAIVERIIEVHHGELILQNLETGGASITLCFPYQHTNQSLTFSHSEQREHAA